MSGLRLHALFFDFDGLLCDTERATRRSWQELYARLGHVFPEPLWLTMAGNSGGYQLAAADLAARLGRSVTGDELAWRLGRKRELSDAEPLRPGVPALLDEAAERRLRLAVVSSAARSWVGGHLDRLGVRDRFAVIVTGEDEARHKPAPDLYLRALARTGVGTDEVTAFEDSAVGVAACRAAGLACVAVPSAVGRHADLTGATAMVDSLDGFSLDTLAVVLA